MDTIREYTLAVIKTTKPSDGWTMRNIQAEAVEVFPHWEKDYVYSVVRNAVLQHCNQQENRVRTKLKAFTADIYRVRKYKKAYKVYRTARGWAITIHKAYWYFNTGKPFHKTAKAVVDIRGDESVETRYTRPKWRVWIQDINYRRPEKMRWVA